MSNNTNHENVYTDLPKGWTVQKFGDLFDIKGGSQPPKKHFIDEPKDGYIRLLQIRDFGNKPVPTYVPKDLVTKFCDKDDVFIARYGASLGRILTGMEGAYNVALAKVIYDKTIVNKWYIFYLLQTPIFQTPIKMISRSAQNGFNKDDLQPIKIPLAPLDQQKRIVAKIEELFSHIDAGIASLQQAKKLLAQYRQSILKSAVTGELTKDWREQNNLTYENEWSDVTINDVAKVIDPNPSHRYPSYDNGSIPLMATKQMVGENDWDDSTAKLTTEKFYEERKSAHGFNSEDIIFARKGRLGLARKPPSLDKYAFSHTVFIIRPNKDINSNYLMWYLRLNECISWLLREINTGAGVPTLGKAIFSKLPISIPSIDEQSKIVSIIKDQMTSIQLTLQNFEDQIKRSDKSKQSILKSAFAGELNKGA